MTLVFRGLLIAASLCTALYFLTMIRKAKVRIEDTVFWFLFSFAVIILSLFPGIVVFFAGLLGVQSPVNFLYLVMIFVLLIRVFKLTLKVSILEYNLNGLGQQIALRDDGSADS